MRLTEELMARRAGHSTDNADNADAEKAMETGKQLSRGCWPDTKVPIPVTTAAHGDTPTRAIK